MEDLLLLALALSQDLIIGDPHNIFHPVQAMGYLIRFLERKLYRENIPKRALFVRGACLSSIVLAISFLFFWFLGRSLKGWPIIWWLVNVWFGGTTLAGKSLADSARSIYLPLKKGDLKESQRALGMIVTRDCGSLSRADIARGAIESVAENTADGVIAPLFYLTLGGVPLAMAYKAINTLDSMIGYRNERYRHFGRFAARLDDFANYLPARITALFMVLSAFLLKLNGSVAWRVMWRDNKKHPSPNSGWPEAASAGALGVVLGGETSYFGQISTRPLLGEGGEAPTEKHLAQAVRLMYLSYILAFFAFLSLKYILSW